MASLLLTVTDDSLLERLRRACLMLKGVESVSIQPTAADRDITLTAGYREAMDDVAAGRVSEYASADELFDKLGIGHGIQREDDPEV